MAVAIGILQVSLTGVHIGITAGPLLDPFVGFLTNTQEFKGNFEIDEIFTVPISFLLDPSNVSYKHFKRNNLKVYIPSWVYNGNKIWGLTAMIAADFLNICFDASIKTNFDLIRTYDEY